MNIIAGIDIGGTKGAISFAEYRGGEVNILDKVVMATQQASFSVAMDNYISCIRKMLASNSHWFLQAVGVSCGGPLDSKKGLILSPPNLPRWQDVDCLRPLREAFHVPVGLQNDADACALAEWTWGAGKGCENMAFLTFGTGMGAGLILGGRLYVGSSNLAGEIGHVRMEKSGPCGHGKEGSFEGFCSGGGIANLGRTEAKKALDRGERPLFCPDAAQLDRITAKTIADALEQGDILAQKIYLTVGRHLGRGVALLIDLLNPEIVVIGSIYVRQRKWLEPVMREEIAKEALSVSAAACKVVPAGLGEMVGDYASISVGVAALGDKAVSKKRVWA